MGTPTLPIVLLVNVFVWGLLAAVFGGDVGLVVFLTTVEFLKPILVVLTVLRVWQRPPEGAGQLRAVYHALRERERPEGIGPALLVFEVVAATLGVVGFAGLVFFADFGRVPDTSLALLFGFRPVYIEGSVASLAVYSLGVTLWMAAWVLEGLELTGTNPLAR